MTFTVEHVSFGEAGKHLFKNSLKLGEEKDLGNAKEKAH